GRLPAGPRARARSQRHRRQGLLSRRRRGVRARVHAGGKPAVGFRTAVRYIEREVAAAASRFRTHTVRGGIPMISQPPTRRTRQIIVRCLAGAALLTGCGNALPDAWGPTVDVTGDTTVAPVVA